VNAGLTPFQTVGPYLHLGLVAGRAPMTAPHLTTPMVITGRLVDGAGAGIADGVLEFWAPGFAMVGRVWTATDGAYHLDTLKPQTRLDADGGVHAPHFAVRVLARGILTEYLTRVYFADEPDTARDVVWNVVPVDRRDTLIAVPVPVPAPTQDTASVPARPAAPASAPAPTFVYHFDVVVQGPGETVFFDV